MSYTNLRGSVTRLLFCVMAVIGLMLSPPLTADETKAQEPPFIVVPRPVPPAPRTPETVFGNYAGAGKCQPSSPKPCRDSGAFDNVFLERVEKPETDMEAQQRVAIGREKTDTRIVIRIARDHGQSCAFGGEMYWAGNHLEFQDKPPYGAKICKLQLWFENEGMVVKDSGEVCGWKFCSSDKPLRLAGRRFKKGPDALLAAYKKSPAPPPATIFGTYRGTGGCATDERKDEYCSGNKDEDYIVIQPGEAGSTHVTVSSKRKGGDPDFVCLYRVEAKWFGDHLVFIEEQPGKPGSPAWVQFWFKNDTVVMRDNGDEHCASYYEGKLFERFPRH